jgi:hypothetical protein
LHSGSPRRNADVTGWGSRARRTARGQPASWGRCCGLRWP